MPKSKNRKNHKQKVNAYKQNVKIANRLTREKLINDFNEKMRANQDLKRQDIGEIITNSDIDVDIDYDDLNIEINEDVDVDPDIESMLENYTDVEEIKEEKEEKEEK